MRAAKYLRQLHLAANRPSVLGRARGRQLLLACYLLLLRPVRPLGKLLRLRGSPLGLFAVAEFPKIAMAQRLPRRDSVVWVVCKNLQHELHSFRRRVGDQLRDARALGRLEVEVDVGRVLAELLQQLLRRCAKDTVDPLCSNFFSEHEKAGGAKHSYLVIVSSSLVPGKSGKRLTISKNTAPTPQISIL